MKKRPILLIYACLDVRKSSFLALSKKRMRTKKKREFVFKRDKNWLIKPGFQQLIRSNYFIDNKEIKYQNIKIKINNRKIRIKNNNRF